LLPPVKRGGTSPYAGFSEIHALPALASLREAYRRITETELPSQQPMLEETSRAIARALAPGALSGRELEEARLIDCKIAMRLAERSPAALPAAGKKLEDFLRSAPSPAFASEARGWLARIFYLKKEYVRAAKIYLDEVNSNESPLNRDTLVTSLRLVYSAGQTDLWLHLEEFFDTPRHALFMVNLLTNQSSDSMSNKEIQSLLKPIGHKVLRLLEDHPALFKSGADSEALVMALMRTSLYMGDSASALKYADAIPKSGTLSGNPEFNWMIAIARFAQQDYAQAEAPLLRMLNARSATAVDRATAAQALIGSYLKTNRPVDALHAALIQVSQRLDDRDWEDLSSPRMQWCFWGTNLDLPYLLDAYLTDEQLREYLEKYPKPVGPPLSVFSWGQQGSLSAPQVVRYSLAVLYARQEKYEAAAQIYTELGIGARARRMRTLAGLFARTRDEALPASERLTALYIYATYLADNPERLFFNDLFWRGMQRYVFLEQDRYQSSTGSPMDEGDLAETERQAALANDRRLRDEQEERWKAYQVLEKVAREAGHSELGRKAAAKILDCLVRINTGRFGRDEEIQKAISTWIQWLRTS